MQVAIEEWDRCEAGNRSASMGMEEDTDTTWRLFLMRRPRRSWMVGGLEDGENRAFAGIAGVEGTTVVPAPIRIWLLVMKNVL
jgi:hypothetical protein